MSHSDDEITKRILEHERQQAAKELDRDIRQSRLSISLAIVLSLLVPLAGYIYTRRWKALLTLLGSLSAVGFIIGASSRDNSQSFARSLAIGSVISTIVAPLDNAMAIQRARDKIRNQTK